MNETQELISITDAAKKLGINRSTLNRFINDAKLKKIKRGRVALVNYQSVFDLVQKMAATGRIRAPKSSKQIKSHDDQWKELYQEMKNERDEFKERCYALEKENYALQGEVKLLKAAPNTEEKEESKTLKNLSWLDKGKVIAKILST